MSDQNKEWKAGIQKKIIIYSLYAGAIAIMCLGSYYSVYSLRNNIHFQVINTTIPGFILGILVIYLGLRNYFQVSDFKENFLKSKEAFSWSNFRKRNRKLIKKINMIKGR